MAGKITNGIDSISIGGEVLGLTLVDSFAFNVDDQTTEQSFEVEENDDPLFTTRSGSKILGFSFQIADPDEDAIETLFGGTAIAGGVEIDGISNTLKKQEVIITAKQGWTITFTQADIDAEISSDLGKNSLFGITVNGRQNGGKISFVDPE